jgi:hypothetical protein
MPQAKIREEFKTTFIAFNGRGYLELGQRDDIDDLAITALESGNKSLLQVFEQPMPTLAALKKNKTDEELKAFVPAAEVAKVEQKEETQEQKPGSGKPK